MRDDGKGGPKKRQQPQGERRRAGRWLLLWDIRHHLAMHGTRATERGSYWLTRDDWARLRFPGGDPSAVFVRIEWWRWRRWFTDLGVTTQQEREDASQRSPLRVALSLEGIYRAVDRELPWFKENSRSD